MTLAESPALDRSDADLLRQLWRASLQYHIETIRLAKPGTLKAAQVEATRKFFADAESSGLLGRSSASALFAALDDDDLKLPTFTDSDGGGHADT